MPAANILRNRKMVIKNLLDKKSDEKIAIGSIDGEVRVIKRYSELDNTKHRPKRYHMSMFPTDRRIIVYQANTGLKRDIYAQLPYDEISEITYIEIENGSRNVCVTEFIAPDDSKYPSIVFKMDTTGHPEDLEQYKVILAGIARFAKTKVLDYTPTNDEL